MPGYDSGDTVDQAAFSDLIDTHARLIASAIRRVCSRRNAALIPDIEQDVRTALWKRLQDGKEIAHPVSYIYKVAMTTALAAVRRFPTAPELPAEPYESGSSGETFLGLRPAEQSRLLAEGLAALPLDEARAVRAHLAGFNHEDVAALFGWSAATARHRIYRGLARLRAKLRGETS